MGARTGKIEQVKQRILQRLQEGFHRPGDRFLSNRAASKLFGISYQTAHRLLEELCSEGHLNRRSQSGTYIPGARRLRGVELAFHRRAERSGSFGAKLLSRLTAALRAEGIDWRIQQGSQISDDRLVVVWENPRALEQAVRDRRSAVLINDRPRPGLGSMFIDSVLTDDFGGGVIAAELLMRRSGRRGRFAVVAGPRDDTRSRLRVEGFRSALPQAKVIHGGGWYFEQGHRCARRAIDAGSDGVFCCNDRLAEGVIRWCGQQGRTPPPIVGHDDAPVAESLGISTVAIPWDELVRGAVEAITRRLSGDDSVAIARIMQPRPVIRG